MHNDFLDDDKLHEECGVFGIFDVNDAAAHIALGLHALQHRGQEAAGIATTNSEEFYVHRRHGLVGEIFGKQKVIDRLEGRNGIGHTRYSTTGGNSSTNIQPIFADFNFGGFALAHNGNLTNAGTLRESLIKRGSIFSTTMDTEVMMHLTSLSQEECIVNRLIEALKQVHGAYAVLGLTKEKMIGIRDPQGVRPLVLGKLDESYVLASESCAFDIIGAEFIRDIEPGEVVVITADGIESIKPFENTANRFCIFEYIYFARPDSFVNGQNVYQVRKRIGQELAKEHPANADVIVPIPDSGVPAAIGYSETSGIPFELGIIRNHYIGRTFIEPGDQIRHLGVKLKHNANRSMIEGKSVVLIDDSIVRGTTSRKIVDMIRGAGAKEIHMRIASPPVTHPYFYGIDMPTASELIASNMSVDEIAKQIGVDSLGYLSLDGLYRGCGEENGRNNKNPQYSDTCFTGDYHIPLIDQEGGSNGNSTTKLRETG